MPADYCLFKIRKGSHLLSDGSEKYGLAEWRNGRRRARLSLHAEREGPQESQRGSGATVDAGRIRLVTEKLQRVLRTREP